MNAFQRAEEQRLFKERRIVPVWIEFRAAVNTLINSYNDTEEGRIHPASGKSQNDTDILISCDKQRAADQIHTVTLTIQISLNKGVCTITVSQERWLRIHGSRVRKENDSTAHFKLDANFETSEEWLVGKGGTRWGVFACAESVLKNALAPQP